MNLNTTDHRMLEIIESEKQRQEETINLIASENYVSSAVMEATSSVLTNKYAEEYVSKRYYTGCAFIVLIACISRPLFGMQQPSIQPSSNKMAVINPLRLIEELIFLYGVSSAISDHKTICSCMQVCKNYNALATNLLLNEASLQKRKSLLTTLLSKAELNQRVSFSLEPTWHKYNSACYLTCLSSTGGLILKHFELEDGQFKVKQRQSFNEFFYFTLLNYINPFVGSDGVYRCYGIENLPERVMKSCGIDGSMLDCFASKTNNKSERVLIPLIEFKSDSDFLRKNLTSSCPVWQEGSNKTQSPPQFFLVCNFDNLEIPDCVKKYLD